MLKLVNKAVGSSKEVVEQNKEKLVLRSNMELRKKITEFYYQPDVSYTCPGERLCAGEEKGWEQGKSS